MRTRTLIAGILVSGISLAALVPAVAQQQAGPQTTTVAQWGPHHRGMGRDDRDHDRFEGRRMGREMRGPMTGRGMMGGMGTRALEEFDTDGDGRITQAEIDAALSGRLSQYDANGDGTLGLEEFQQLWLDQTRPMMVRAFQNRDADGNGQVTREELGRGFDRLVERMDRNDDGALDEDDRWQRRGFDRRGPGGPGGPAQPAPGNN